MGRAIARRLVEVGWDVTVGSRGATKVPEEVAAACRCVTLDRARDDDVKRALGEGADVFVDVIPYERRDAEQLLGLKSLVGSIVAISSASVYADDQGRSLDTIPTRGYPHLPSPIPETQLTVAPGDDTYSTKKAAIEEMLLSQSELVASILRPCAIYGPGDTLCREWFFVKRALDRRPHVLLAYRGKSIFHTTSVHNVAELVRLVAEDPRTRVLNCGDPDPPDVLRIARRLAEMIGHEWTEILVPPERSQESFIRNPWATPWPFVVDMTKAKDELGYQPVTTYDEAIAETVGWIRRVASPNEWKQALARAADYLGERFDYDAEDAFLRSDGELGM